MRTGQPNYLIPDFTLDSLRDVPYKNNAPGEHLPKLEGSPMFIKEHWLLVVSFFCLLGLQLPAVAEEADADNAATVQEAEIDVDDLFAGPWKLFDFFRGQRGVGIHGLPLLDARYVNQDGDTLTGLLQLPADGLVVGDSQLIVIGGAVGIGTASPQAG